MEALYNYLVLLSKRVLALDVVKTYPEEIRCLVLEQLPIIRTMLYQQGTRHHDLTCWTQLDLTKVVALIQQAQDILHINQPVSLPEIDLDMHSLKQIEAHLITLTQMESASSTKPCIII